MRLLIALVAALAPCAHAQFWTTTPTDSAPAAEPGQLHSPGPRPKSGNLVKFDPDSLRTFLSRAPDHRPDLPLSAYGLHLRLPSPDAGAEPIDCVAARSAVMEPPLAARYPLIQTFLVESADRSASGRFELTQRGLTAMLRSDRGTWMIDPWRSGDPSRAISYWFADLQQDSLDWKCETTPGIHGWGTPEDSHPYLPRDLQPLRAFRLAVACTGEYGLYHSTIQGRPPNIADPLAAIVTVVARANVVYEADLAVHLTLVATNDAVVFVDPTTDPYPSSCTGTGGTDCSGPLLDVNTSVLDSRIGASNYNTGHVLTRIAGGVAYLSSVCGSNRAGGVSGIPRGGDIDPFAALVVIHELGHQFGANHTFSGTLGRCAGNINPSTAWEAGSGSTPMAYAGACPVGDGPPSENVARFADPFFHHGSYGEMRSFLTNSAVCATTEISTNTIPVIQSVTASTNIPPSTPFVLTALARDDDGDPLTYSWEQFDSGVARAFTGPASADNGQGSLFRVFPPSSSPSRTFPRMADVLSGVPSPGERLPSFLGAVRRFRVIVRDNHPSAGGVAVSPFVNLTIAPGTSPFTVSSPAAGAVLFGGPTPVTWTVGNTDRPPISCASVTIRLSTVGGSSFPITLGTLPNTGAATVSLPAITAPARIRIDADNRIFFAVSPAFVLAGPCTADVDNGSATGTRDGAVSIDDLLYYLDRYAAGAPAADVDDGSGTGTPDSTITIDDLLYFAARYNSGC